MKRLPKTTVLMTLLLLPLSFATLRAQEPLSLEDCYQAAQDNLPVLKNADLIGLQAELQTNNLQAQKLPQLQLIANGSFQSENIALEFPPQVPIENIELPLYRAQLYAEVNYLLYDGGRLKAAKDNINALAQRQMAQLEIPAEQVRETVQQLFFSIHILRKQQEILQAGIATLQEREQAVQAAVDAGVLLPGNLSELRAKILETESLLLQAQQNEAGARRALSVLTQLELSAETPLALPEETAITPENSDFSQRADLRLFAFRQMELDARARQIEANRKPTLAAFAKGGVGYPNPLNLFDDQISPYGIVGLQLSWKPFDWGIAKRNKEALQLESAAMQNERAQLVQQYSIRDVRLREQLALYELQIEKDRQLLDMQKQIAREAATQLEQGTITSADYLVKWNEVQQTQLRLELHRIQQLQTSEEIKLLNNAE